MSGRRRNPNKPREPLNMFMMSHIEWKQNNPKEWEKMRASMKLNEIGTFFQNNYHNLSDAERKRLHDKYDTERAKYKAAVEEFNRQSEILRREEHRKKWGGVFTELEEVYLQREKKEHWKKWKWVSAELEVFPPEPKNYSHLPVFSSSTYLGREGGVDFQEGLEEFKELEALG